MEWHGMKEIKKDLIQCSCSKSNQGGDPRLETAGLTWALLRLRWDRLLIKDAVFCSPTCFKDNCEKVANWLFIHRELILSSTSWLDGTHKKLHVPAIRTALAGEGTNDIVNNLNRTPIILDPLIYPVGSTFSPIYSFPHAHHSSARQTWLKINENALFVFSERCISFGGLSLSVYWTFESHLSCDTSP